MHIAEHGVHENNKHCDNVNHLPKDILHHQILCSRWKKCLVWRQGLKLRKRKPVVKNINKLNLCHKSKWWNCANALHLKNCDTPSLSVDSKLSFYSCQNHYCSLRYYWNCAEHSEVNLEYILFLICNHTTGNRVIHANRSKSIKILSR